MEQQFCPGAKILRQPEPEFTSCPNCGEEVEIWSDEQKRPCPRCSETVIKDRGEEQVSCLDWCAMGKECVGEKAYQRYMQSKSENLKTRLLQTFAEWCNNEEALRRLKEEILPTAEKLVKEKGGDPHIIFPALIFRDMKSCWFKSHTVSEKNEGTLKSDYEKFVQKILFKEGLQKEAIQAISSLLFVSPKEIRDNENIAEERSAEGNLDIIVNIESK